MLTVFAGFLLGIVFASFLNVAAGGGKSPLANILRSRSVCDSCGLPLRWWELVPVLSWIALGGRCGRCGKQISAFHPVSEFILGLSIAGVVWQFSADPLALLEMIVLVFVLYFFAVYDYHHGIVRDRYLFPVLGVAFSYQIIMFIGAGAIDIDVIVGALAYPAVIALLIGAGLAGVIPGVRRGVQGFGWGDVKLAILIGLMLGWLFALISFALAVFSGALVGVILLATKGKPGMKIPFVPFMYLGAVGAIVFGSELLSLWFRLYNI